MAARDCEAKKDALRKAFKALQTMEMQIPGTNRRADRMGGAPICLTERKPSKLQPGGGEQTSPAQ